MAQVSAATRLVTQSSLSGLGFVYGQNGVLKLSPVGQTMVNYLPQYMQDGDMVRKIQEALALEVYRAIASRQDLLNQLFIETATWGLKYWEEMAGLPVREDAEDTYPLRRSIVQTSLGARHKESEFWFKKRLEDLVGTVYIDDQDPVVAKYTDVIEVVAQIVEEPPSSNSIAVVSPDAGFLDGQYAYRITYNFLTGETTAPQSLPNTNEMQVLTTTGIVSGGTLAITYDDGFGPQVTGPIPYNATPDDVRLALLALPNLSSLVPEAVRVVGGPLPDMSMAVEFIGALAGQPQLLMTVDSSLLTGGGTIDAARLQHGGIYGQAESNAVEPVNQQVILLDVPLSPSIAIGRRIYRKKNPEAIWRFVGEITDNADTTYIDNVDDATVAAAAELSPFNTATNALGTALLDLIKKTKPAHLHIIMTSEHFLASINVAGDRV